jgi:hypothetical protein
MVSSEGEKVEMKNIPISMSMSPQSQREQKEAASSIS